MFNRSHISLTVNTPSLKYSSQSTAFCRFFLPNPYGAPKIFPLRFAEARPALVRSLLIFKFFGYNEICGAIKRELSKLLKKTRNGTA